MKRARKSSSGLVFDRQIHKGKKVSGGSPVALTENGPVVLLKNVVTSNV